MILIFYVSLLVFGGAGAVAGDTAGSALAGIGLLIGGLGALGYAFLLEGF